jgi:hypothetical protein
MSPSCRDGPAGRLYNVAAMVLVTTNSSGRHRRRARRLRPRYPDDASGRIATMWNRLVHTYFDVGCR